jgi:hypothetical protein
VKNIPAESPVIVIETYISTLAENNYATSIRNLVQKKKRCASKENNKVWSE